MLTFSEIVNKVLINEGFAEDGTLYVYHFTHKENLASISKGGFSRYFTGKNSNAYGPGVYTNMEPSCSTDSLAYDDLDRKRIEVYGSMMLKLKVVKGGLRNFLIFHMPLARRVYGHHWRVEDQLKLILDPDTYERVKREQPRDWQTICQEHYDKYATSDLARVASHMCERDKTLDNLIRGYAFTGRYDGYVAIFKDFTVLKPVAVSYDLGHNFKEIKVDPRYDEYVINNYDIWRELGVENCYNVKTNQKKYGANAFYDVLPKYFTKGYARVEKDGKYNYLYIKTFKEGPISPVWFDAAPVTFDSDGMANVTIEGMLYKLRNYNDMFLIYDEKGKLISSLEDFNLNKNEQENQENNDFDFEYD